MRKYIITLTQLLIFIPMQYFSIVLHESGHALLHLIDGSEHVRIEIVSLIEGHTYYSLSGNDIIPNWYILFAGGLIQGLFFLLIWFILHDEMYAISSGAAIFYALGEMTQFIPIVVIAGLLMLSIPLIRIEVVYLDWKHEKCFQFCSLYD